MRWMPYAGLLCLTGCFLEPNNTFSVTGSVVSEASAEAIPGALVQLMYHAPFTSWGELSVLGSATTGADGKFTVKWPEPGMYWMEAVVRDEATPIKEVKQRRAGYSATFEVLPQ